MPRSRISSGKVPIQVTDLGTKLGSRLDFSDPSLYNRMRASVWHLAREIPVYLVDLYEILMLLPPENKRIITPRAEECIDSKLMDFSVEIDSLWVLEEEDEERAYEKWNSFWTNLWDRIDGCVEELVDTEEIFQWIQSYAAPGSSAPPLPHGHVKVIPLLGLYLRNGATKKVGDTEVEGPAIFLCPEAIIAAAVHYELPLPLMLAKVYYHELGHAELDSAPLPGLSRSFIADRMIEESLCNLLALSHFQDRKEATLVMRPMEASPREYRGYKYVWQADEAVKLSPYYDDDEWWVRYYWRRGRRIWGIREDLREYLMERLPRRAPLSDVIKLIGAFVRESHPRQYWWSGLDTTVIGWQVLTGHYFFSHEPPVPMPYLEIAQQWYRFKREACGKGPRAEHANYWLRLATALLFKLSGKM